MPKDNAKLVDILVTAMKNDGALIRDVHRLAYALGLSLVDVDQLSRMHNQGRSMEDVLRIMTEQWCSMRADPTAASFCAILRQQKFINVAGET